jgi:hypothetical protein
MTTHNPTGTVPAQDSPDNATGLDVLGNKTDTVAGDSLVSLSKINAASLATVDGLHDVPATDSAANLQIRDVVGSKLDRAYNGGSSLFAELHNLEEHAHSRAYVLPDRASPITATAGNGWAYGAASATLGTPAFPYFDIHWLDIVAGANAQYQALILVGGVPVSEVSFERISPVTRSVPQPVLMQVVAAGPITIQLASSVNGATATFKASYHPY